MNNKTIIVKELERDMKRWKSICAHVYTKTAEEKQQFVKKLTLKILKMHQKRICKNSLSIQ